MIMSERWIKFFHRFVLVNSKNKIIRCFKIVENNLVVLNLFID